jgi:hypothetical protein
MQADRISRSKTCLICFLLALQGVVAACILKGYRNRGCYSPGCHNYWLWPADILALLAQF